MSFFSHGRAVQLLGQGQNAAHQGRAQAGTLPVVAHVEALDFKAAGRLLALGQAQGRVVAQLGVAHQLVLHVGQQEGVFTILQFGQLHFGAEIFGQVRGHVGRRVGSSEGILKGLAAEVGQLRGRGGIGLGQRDAEGR